MAALLTQSEAKQRMVGVFLNIRTAGISVLVDLAVVPVAAGLVYQFCRIVINRVVIVQPQPAIPME
jgi:hypothetical protein